MSLPDKPSLKRNIAANFIGQGWSIVVGLLVVPFYIRFIGVEGYGLVGLYATLQAIFNSFLDFGLSLTINREIARFTASPDKAGNTRDLVRTIEIIYWAIGLILGILICSNASLISVYWIHSETIPVETIKSVILIMGFITFFQWPQTFYQGGLIGLQKMIPLNGILIFTVTFRGLGAILVMYFISRSVLVFFLWQLLTSILQLVLGIVLLWRNLPASDHAPRFCKVLLEDIWRFAVGMSATSFFSFFINQADKIILSKFLTLEYFGYYSLATTLNNQLQLISAQIIQPLFPRFSALVSIDAAEELKQLFHRAAQFISVIFLPVAGALALFSPELIRIWIQDQSVSTLVAPIVFILFLGTAVRSLVEVSFSLTVATGWVKLSFYNSLISFVLLMPILAFLSWHFGGTGAAFSWMILNVGYFLILPPIIHRRILKGELKRWYLQDIGYPLIVSTVILITARWIIPGNLPSIAYGLLLPVVVLITIGIAILAAGKIRSSVMIYYKRLTSFLLNR
ncbi:MAG: hypothetical protein C4586_06110 [Anaerolineaceae bacterium]|nr:MAG: hypothetical protein C4586_06110 [Anaerolineaceae bacterium]